jgi:methylthioribose-1-phosphate isomerase
MFSPIRFSTGIVDLLDQRKLPASEEWLRCESTEQVASAIEDMVVRGAPAIGCAAALGMLVDLERTSWTLWHENKNQFSANLQRMRRTRPTAVNLFFALDKMAEAAAKLADEAPSDSVRATLRQIAEAIFWDDQKTCVAMGEHGADLFSKPVRILTHCNAGALATAGYGTALGVIRSLHKRGLAKHVFADETRPWLQGARLTVWELMQEEISCSLNCEGAAAFLMANGEIDAVITGADRIAANGDTANKVGTLGVAIAAKYFGIPFYVAAPFSTFDLKASSAKDIPIEYRAESEVLEFRGTRHTPMGLKAVNPSFDITTHGLITGIITERGVIKAPYIDSIAEAFRRRL